MRPWKLIRKRFARPRPKTWRSNFRSLSVTSYNLRVHFGDLFQPETINESMDLLKGNMLFAHDKEGAFHPSAALKVRLKEPVAQGIIELSLDNSSILE
jgi:hypothetical protein